MTVIPFAPIKPAVAPVRALPPAHVRSPSDDYVEAITNFQNAHSYLLTRMGERKDVKLAAANLIAATHSLNTTYANLMAVVNTEQTS